MIKIFSIFLIFLLNNCSFDTKSGIWTNDENIKTEINSKKTKNLFKITEIIKDELNPNFRINVPLEFKNIMDDGNNDNSFLNFDLNLKKISRYRFSKIDNFDYFDPTLVFYNDDLIFFNNKGSLLRFKNNSKIVWKKNYYNKIEKKNFPILNFSIKNEILIVTDSLSKYYAVILDTGKIIWDKDHNVSFISNIKIDDDRFYIVDANNVIYCFSLLDGSKIWEFATDYELVKSQKKLSIVFDNEKIYFNNSIGNVYSLDKNNGNLVWVTYTKDNNNFLQSFLLKTSKLIMDDNNLYFSNNQNSLFSVDKNSGFVNWRQNINSEIKPLIVDNLIFSISSEGLLFIVEKNSGSILRITNVFNQFKKRKREKIRPTGMILDIDSIFITLNNGKIIDVNIDDGKSYSTFKISRSRISQPFINKEYMFTVKDNEIIRLN